MEIKLLGGLDGHERKGGGIQTGYQVFDPCGLCPTLLSLGGGYGIMIIEENMIDKQIVAMHGRGGNNEQRLEPRADELTNTLTTVQKDNLVIEKVGQISNEGSQCGTVVLDEGLSPTLTAGTHGYANPHICVKQATKKGYIECKERGVADLSYPSSKSRRGRVQDGGESCPTITINATGLCRLESRYRIRKLTPREYWRLMGFSDTDFDKAEKVCSNTQLYKQAGNSIVVNVLMGIFSQML